VTLGERGCASPACPASPARATFPREARGGYTSERTGDPLPPIPGSGHGEASPDKEEADALPSASASVPFLARLPAIYTTTFCFARPRPTKNLRVSFP
jgi:hypothetical protein